MWETQPPPLESAAQLERISPAIEGLGSEERLNLWLSFHVSLLWQKNLNEGTKNILCWTQVRKKKTHNKAKQWDGNFRLIELQTIEPLFFEQ